MMNNLSSHLALVPPAATSTVKELTSLLFWLTQVPNTSEIRAELPGLIARVNELYGVCQSVQFVSDTLTALPQPSTTQQNWTSDFYYLENCVRKLENLKSAAAVSWRGNQENGVGANGDVVPQKTANQSPALTLPRIRAARTDLQRLTARLRKACSCLDLYSLHRAVSQDASIKSVVSPEGSTSPDSASGPPSNEDPLKATLRLLDQLNLPIHDRFPSPSYHAEITMIDVRNKTNPDYMVAAVAWVSVTVNHEWQSETLRRSVLLLLGLPPQEPPRANSIQWLLEYSRQSWPKCFGDAPLSSQPFASLVQLSKQDEALPLYVAASLGLTELCREFLTGHYRGSLAFDPSKLFYSALLGPSALLANSHMTVWERINERPHSVDQARLLRLCLDAGYDGTSRWLWSYKTPPPTPPEHLAFLVCLRLRDSELFLKILTRCGSFSEEFINLVQPGPLWEPFATLYELCSSERDYVYMNEVLVLLMDRILPTSYTHLPRNRFSHLDCVSLFDGAFKLSQRLGLKCSRPEYVWLADNITDELFEDEVRSHIQDGNSSIVRRLVQDPRWRADISYNPKSTPPEKADGGTILHLAVEGGGIDALEIVETLLKSGADVEAVDKKNRTALMLCEEVGLFRLLVKYGASTLARDVDGLNCWHFAAKNFDVATLRWLSREDPNMRENLRTASRDGFTPLAEAVKTIDVFSKGESKGAEQGLEAALFLCEVVHGDADCLKSPTPLLHYAAQWGNEQLIKSLLDLGVDTNQLDSDGSGPLHHLNFSASLAVVQLLRDACPNAPVQRLSDKLTPVETMFLNFNPTAKAPKNRPQPTDASTHPSFSMLDDRAFRLLLATPGVLSSKDHVGDGLWRRFCLHIVARWASRQEPSYAVEVITTAIQCLARGKALLAYEEETGTSGIPLFRECSAYITNIWHPTTLSQLYDVLLAETTHLESFVQSSAALSLLNTAVLSNAGDLIDVLLKKGVSVHERPANNTRDRRTALETACIPGTRTSKYTFEKLLEHADPSRLDELDPSSSQGVIHLLAAPGVHQRDQKLTALLDRGADPNLIRWKKTPNLVAYILERQVDAALILLNKGADPSLLTKEGMDAALAAASRGCTPILEKIKALRSVNFNWSRTCISHFTLIHPGGARVTTTASNCNALHLAAFNGHDVVLQFYLLHFKLDINAPIQEDLRRPVHFAAISGSSSCIRVLHQHGADLKARTRDGSTPLHTAVRGSQAQTVKMLLELEPQNSNLEDNEFMTPFMYALRIGFGDIIKLFANIGPLRPSPQVGPMSEARPLRARLIGETIESVIRSGDLLQCQNLLAVTSIEELETSPLKCEGCTPMILAIREMKPAIVQWLLSKGCRGFIGSCPGHYRRYRQLGFNALNMICEKPKLTNPCLPTMLVAYLRENIDWTSASMSPIHTAARANNSAAVSLIVDHIRSQPIAYRQRFRFGGMDPMLGVEKDPELLKGLTEQMVQHVLNQAVTTNDIPEISVPGYTPLHIAASLGNEEVMGILLRLGADPNVEDEDLNRPLHIAVRNNFDAGVQLLIRHGADMNRFHGQGSTPLMAAVEAGNLEISQMLVKEGADIHVTDPDGMSLLNIAGERTKNPAIIHYLLSLGLSPYKRDKAEYMPIDDMILNYDMLGFVLNGSFDMTRLRELNKGFFSLVIELNRGNAVVILKRLFRRLPKDKIAKMINATPKRFVSALCNAVYRDTFDAIDVLVKNGADVNLEGSVEGTALMAACSRGRLQSVKLLMERGARIAYTVVVDGVTVVKNGIELADRRGFSEISDWLLVRRFTDMKLIEGVAIDDAGGDYTPGRPAGTWGGPWTAAYKLQGMYHEHPREPKESRIAYLARMSALRDSLRGQVLRAAELVRPSSDPVDLPEISIWDLERAKSWNVTAVFLRKRPSGHAGNALATPTHATNVAGHATHSGSSRH